MLACRLLMAQAFAQLLVKAFDALLHYNINFRNLPEYQDRTLLDEADKLVILQGCQKVMLWMERVDHAIDAAIRRKQFLDVNRQPPQS